MSIFGMLIVPLPYTMKRKLFNFISDSPIVAKFQYGMKVSAHLSGPQRGPENPSQGLMLIQRI